jgi:hypothetical protein
MQFTAPYALVGDSARLPSHLHPEHLADLRASGLNDNSIRAAGVYSIRPCDINLFFNARKGVPPEIASALCFPYQGGEFARLKLFPPLGKMKYAQPPKTGRPALSSVQGKRPSGLCLRGREENFSGASSWYECGGYRRALELAN